MKMIVKYIFLKIEKVKYEIRILQLDEKLKKRNTSKKLTVNEKKT